MMIRVNIRIGIEALVQMLGGGQIASAARVRVQTSSGRTISPASTSEPVVIGVYLTTTCRHRVFTIAAASRWPSMGTDAAGQTMR